MVSGSSGEEIMAPGQKEGGGGIARGVGNGRYRKLGGTSGVARPGGNPVGTSRAARVPCDTAGAACAFWDPLGCFPSSSARGQLMNISRNHSDGFVFPLWRADHLESLLTWTAERFAPSIRESPLPGNVVVRGCDKLEHDSSRFPIFLGQLASLPTGLPPILCTILQHETQVELTDLVTLLAQMTANLVKAHPELARVADDLPNAVFLNLHQTTARYDPAVAPFWSWLKTVTWRQGVKLLK